MLRSSVKQLLLQLRLWAAVWRFRDEQEEFLSFFPRNTTAKIDGETLRQTFVARIIAELSRPERTCNDDLLRGFKASKFLTNREAAAIFVEDHADRIAALCNRLADENSRNCLAFFYFNRALGGLHSQAPHLSREFLKTTARIRNFTSGAGRRLSPHQWLSRPIFIEEYNMPVGDRIVRLDTHDISALEVFLLNQYTYPSVEPIEVKPGDVVLDAGACWGDTSLYFAAKAAPGGRVFAFEMSGENANLLEANLRKNPGIGDSVEIVRRPLADVSGQTIWFKDAGAASRVDMADNGGVAMKTISIDDFVAERGLDRVDFIKFDIEGAERHALDGARTTIQKHRPKLAISIYHLPDDPFVIADQVLSLSDDYELTVRGVCKNFGEIVLFCNPK